MGGVKIDLNCRCNIESLFVAGEDAGGVHGANRLGGNGVADSIVFGGRAGDAIADYLQTASMPNHSESQAGEIAMRWQAILERKSGENPFQLRDQLEAVMWKKVGVVRNGADLTSAIPELAAMRDQLNNVEGSGSAVYNAKWNEAINMQNMIVIAELIAQRPDAGGIARRRLSTGFSGEGCEVVEEHLLRPGKRRCSVLDDGGEVYSPGTTGDERAEERGFNLTRASSPCERVGHGPETHVTVKQPESI